jgi:hypothetical protein
MSFINRIRVSVLTCLLLALATFSFAQDKKAPASPPATTTGKIGNATVTIKYSSPGVKGREVWGQLVPYGQVWRTGANEATTITFDKDLAVEGQTLKAGTYALFTIPTEKEWTVIFNKTDKQWGAFKYEEAQDALRVKAKPMPAKEMNERLKFDIEAKGKNAGTIIMKWEKLQVPVAVKVATTSA